MTVEVEGVEVVALGATDGAVTVLVDGAPADADAEFVTSILEGGGADVGSAAASKKAPKIKL